MLCVKGWKLPQGRALKSRFLETSSSKALAQCKVATRAKGAFEAPCLEFQPSLTGEKFNLFQVRAFFVVTPESLRLPRPYDDADLARGAS